MAGKKETQIDVLKVDHGQLDFCILGTSPIILNRMSVKVLHELLMPKGKKTAAEKAGSLKHNPMEEFRSSPYIDTDENGPTLLQHLSSAFKGAIKAAALDLPGSSKSQIGRLTWVNGEKVSIYGIPELLMSVTRSADMNRTPDVRTRAIVRNWACRVTVSFVRPILREQAIANLLASSGITQGVGDWRPGKGAGTYGQFSLVDPKDPAFLQIIKAGGRKAQQAAMNNPAAYDTETSDLLEWFNVESKKRGHDLSRSVSDAHALDVAAQVLPRKGKTNGAHANG